MTTTAPSFADRQQAVRGVMQAGPVIPVVILDAAEQAVPLANALLEGGVRTIEVTLRTDAAMEGIRHIAADVPGIAVGAGTVLTADQLDDALDAGASFAVSPGAASVLLDEAEDHPLPLLPGASTASEAMALLERGYGLQKFFPAVPAGGVSFLKALASPLPQISFCPTGGIGAANAADFLSLPNVACVGGSWLSPADAVAAGDWGRVTTLAAQAAGLGGAS